MSTSTQSPRIFGNKSGLHNDAMAEGLARAVNKTNSEDKLRKLVDDSRVRVEHAKRVHATQARFSTARLPALAKLADKDGHNHFNLSTAATTALGEALSLTSDLSFTHSHLGQVRCLEGIWGYMLSKPRAKAFLEKPYKSMHWLRKHATLMEDAPNIRLVIADALWQKVSQYKEVVDVLKESTLPFDVYVRSFDGLLKRTFFAGWYIVLVEEIRRSIKSGKEPNLFQFADDEIYTELKDAPHEKQQAYIKDFLNELFAPELVVTQRNQAKREREAAAREEGTRQRQADNEGVQGNKKPETPVTKKDPSTKEERRRAHEELMAKHRADKQARLAKNGTVTEVDLKNITSVTDVTQMLKNTDNSFMPVYHPATGYKVTMVDERPKSDPRGPFVAEFAEIDFSAENIALNPLLGDIPEALRGELVAMTNSDLGVFFINRKTKEDILEDRARSAAPEQILEEVKAIEDEVKAEAQAEAESDPFLRTATEAPAEPAPFDKLDSITELGSSIILMKGMTDTWVIDDIEVNVVFGDEQIKYTVGPLEPATMDALANAGLPMELIDELCMMNVTNAAPANPTTFIVRREDLPKQDI